jgi:hypothetical protein
VTTKSDKKEKTVDCHPMKEGEQKPQNLQQQRSFNKVISLGLKFFSLFY